MTRLLERFSYQVKNFSQLELPAAPVVMSQIQV